MPDAQARRRLLQLYVCGLELRDIDLDAIVTRTEGATPAYIKELLRKAARHWPVLAPSLALWER